MWGKCKKNGGPGSIGGGGGARVDVNQEINLYKNAKKVGRREWWWLGVRVVVNQELKLL